MSVRPATLPADLRFAQLLRARGLRPTAQRRTIYSVFARAAEADAANAHLDAEEVLQQARAHIPELNRGSVHNALGELVEAGLLGVVEGPGARRFDANATHHHHFRCARCGELRDIDPDQVDVALREPGFAVERTHVLLEGLCPRCASGAGAA